MKRRPHLAPRRGCLPFAGHSRRC